MGKAVRIGYVGDLEEPRLVEIESDGEGSFLSAMQGLVGGPIEYVGPPFFGRPALFVNESGVIDGMPPNRAVWASADMAREGYVSAIDYAHAVAEDELYAVLFGPVLAVSHDAEGIPRDISDEEWEAVVREFGGEDAALSGRRAVLAVREGRRPSRGYWEGV